MAAPSTLREFQEHDLLFDADETRAILEFFFPHDRALIAEARITLEVRSFAQGLLVTAIDANEAMGYVEALFRSYARPSATFSKALRKLATNAAKNWFKHANIRNLANVKIYHSIKVEIGRRFRTELHVRLG
ncbi:hypothetical protein [Chitinilyticum litopenaei]|uniref:hypothetical protein n=1 Tax=Chitinilyticum litopenaei TaxID=1121276 RepID=UPI00041BD42E|nr:hypothetical protein [Chitinilyticum litopenaei]